MKQYKWKPCIVCSGTGWMTKPKAKRQRLCPACNNGLILKRDWAMGIEKLLMDIDDAIDDATGGRA